MTLSYCWRFAIQLIGHREDSHPVLGSVTIIATVAFVTAPFSRINT
jgi:hypothetical protein